MLSLRLDSDLDERVRRAAARERASVSEFVRRALDERSRRTLEEPDPWEGIIGAVNLGGGVADRTSEAFGELLEEQHREQQRRR